MALLYRAIWHDARSDLVDVGGPAFRAWLHSKYEGLEVPDSGVVRAGPREVASAFVAQDGISARRIRLVEEKPVPGGEERWTTTAHFMCDSTDGWVWVDLEWVSDNAFSKQPEVSAPRLVGELLELDGANRGQVRLGPNPTKVGSAEVPALIEWLRDDARSVPLVVFSVDQSLSPAGYSERVRESARRLTGCADVRMLTSESESLFDAEMRGDSMSVFGGAARIYLPHVNAENPKPWRHRYIQAHRLSDRPGLAAARISRIILPRMVAQRPPELYRTHVKQLLDLELGEQTDWEAYALELDGVVNTLEREAEELREERDLAFLEAEDAVSDAADALRRLEHLRATMRSEGKSPEAIERQISSDPLPTSCSEAIDFAAALRHLEIHPEAPQDIERLDQSPQAELWAQRILLHLQALDAYAEAKGPGFDVWCNTSGHPRVLSKKFISMTESETVQQNPKFKEKRWFSISKEVNPAGAQYVWSHTKPVQGGGMTIPRIYFHDDSKGKTEKVHIVFVGPHDLVPNLGSK